MQIKCVRGKPRLVGVGLHRQVFKVGNFVLKIEKWKRGKSIDDLRDRAASIDLYQRKIRMELTFLPAFYGAILAEVGEGDATAPAIVTFHEYVKPLPIYSLDTLRAIFNLIKKASEKGYMLDIKPSNFGRKGKRIIYLDEYGVGRGPIPPDVLEDLNNFLKFALERFTIGRGR